MRTNEPLRKIACRAALLTAITLTAFCAKPTRNEPAPASPAVVSRPVESPSIPPADMMPEAIPAPAPTTSAYVPDAACSECHAAIAETFARVGMGRSFYPFSTETAIEDLAGARFDHEPSRRHYEMTVRDGALTFTRYRIDEEGRRIHERTERADFVIGSGNHSRGYLWRSELGEMFQMPVAWYSQEKRWGMAPGYDRAGHDDFDRPVTRQCMFCHNAYPHALEGLGHEVPTSTFGDLHLFPSELPHGIGCQRCHGPGADHVRLAASGEAHLSATRSSIVNPARLSPRLRDDVCQQCHLQPTSRRTSFLRRFGQTDYGYVPGQPLDDYLVHLEVVPDKPTSAGNSAGQAASVPERFEINHHPYRLHQSRCYTETGGALHCTTCHDPHATVPAAEAADQYRSRCLSCHEVDACALPATDHGRDGGDNCAGCHMPRRRTQDVVHVVMTDHLIQRPPRSDPHSTHLLTPLVEAEDQQGGSVRLYVPERGPTGALAAVYAAMSTAIDREPDGAVRLQASLDAWHAEEDRSALEPRLQLGLSRLEAGRLAEAATTFKDLLVLVPDSVPARVNLGVALTALRRHEEALEHLTQVVEGAPDRPDAHYNLAVVLARVGRQDEAEAEYIRTLGLRPNHAKAALNLGNLLARRGRMVEAVPRFEQALRIDPDLAEAYRSLGAAHRRLDCWGEALAVWREGVRVAPQHSGMLVELALAYASSSDPAVRDAGAALSHADRAVRAAPDDADAVLTLGFALAVSNRGEAAMAVTRRAVTLGAPEGDGVLIASIVQARDGRAGESAQSYQAGLEAVRSAGGPVAARRVHEAIALVAGEAQRVADP